MYILDTNVLRAIFDHKGQQPHLETRIKQIPYEHLYISIVSVEEVLRGILELFRRCEKGKELARGYAFLDALFTDLSDFQILSFDQESEEVYERMSAETKRYGKGDCRIAASALRHDYKVITRNVDDFRAIGANYENWFLA